MSQHNFKISESAKHEYKSSKSRRIHFKHYRVDCEQMEHYFPKELQGEIKSVLVPLFDMALERFCKEDIPNQIVLSHYRAIEELESVEKNQTLDALFMKLSSNKTHQVQTMLGRGSNLTYILSNRTNKIQAQQLCAVSSLYLSLENMPIYCGNKNLAHEVLMEFDDFVSKSSFQNLHDLAKSKLQRRINDKKGNWHMKELDIDTNVFSFYKLQF